jgi:nitrate reductase beta subunit
MVWYVPPLSPVQSAAKGGWLDSDDVLPDIASLRIPVKYLANMLTAGQEKPVIDALETMFAMRGYMRGKHVDNTERTDLLERVGKTADTIQDMYQTLAIANYEDRFVIPSNHREFGGRTHFDEDIAFEQRSECGFSFGNGCHDDGGGTRNTTELFGGKINRPASMSGQVYRLEEKK